MTFVQRILFRFKAVFAAQIVRMIAQGGIVVLLTRYLLTPDEYGLLFYAISILAVLLLFANLGLAKSAARYLAEYRETDPSQIPRILRSTLRFNAATILVVGVALGVTAPIAARVLREPALTPFLYVGVAYVGARSLHTFARLTFQGFNQTQLSAYTSIVANVATLAFVIAFVALGFGAVGALVGYTVAYALAAAFGVGIVYRRWMQDADEPAGTDDGLSRRILEYSVPLTATRGANVLDKQIDTILIGFFMTPVAVGYYTLSKQISEFVMTPAASLGFTISPTYGEQKASDDIARAREIYEQTLHHVLLLYVPAAAGIVLVAPHLVPLVFGEAYRDAVVVVQVFSGYVVLQAITNVTSDGLDYLGRARSRAIAKGVTAVANFGLNLLLIPRMGVVGAALATVLTHSAYVAVNLYVVHQELSLRLRSLARQIVIVCAIAVGTVVAAGLALSFATNALAVVTAVLVGVCAWSGLATASGLIDPRQLQSYLR